jgi:uncharacterized membrane protein YcaP (DUF421 family)
MIYFLSIDLLGLGQEKLEAHQMALRVVIVFIYALILLRFAGMKTFGSRSPFDAVTSTVLGIVLAGMITGTSPFFPSMIGTATLVLFHRLVAWITYHSEAARMLTEGEAKTLYHDNHHNEKELRRNAITKNHLERALHEQEMEDYEKVKTIRIEPDGKLTVTKSS